MPVQSVIIHLKRKKGSRREAEGMDVRVGGMEEGVGDGDALL